MGIKNLSVKMAKFHCFPKGTSFILFIQNQPAVELKNSDLEPGAPSASITVGGKLVGKLRLEKDWIMRGHEFLASSAIKKDRNLPEFVFRRKFSKYLFFDVDLAGDSEFVRELERAWFSSKERDSRFEVESFTLPLRRLILASDATSWAEKIINFSSDLHRDRIYEGLTIAHEAATWIAFQRYPVDVGVIAINAEVLEGDKFWANLNKEWFFSMDGIGVDSDISRSVLIENFGISFVEKIIENYLD